MNAVPNLSVVPDPDESEDEMDIAFELPANVTDVKLRKLFYVLVGRMRKEAAHIPMNTVQLLLIERIAYNYIIMRSKEAANTPQEGAFSHATQQKEYNTFWLSMTQEFNKQVRATDAETKAQMMRVMAGVVADVLREIEDPVLQSKLRIRISDGMQQQGL